MSRFAVAAVVLTLSAPALAERPLDVLVPQPVVEGEVMPTGLAAYNTVFLNRCAAGCTIRVGTANSINDTWGISSQRTLTAWPYDDATWQQVVTCIKDVFSPYVINVTDVDPGTANHFEIMIAGAPTDLGMPGNYGGVAPGGCTSTYMNNALVFDFAKVWGAGTTCNGACVEDICSTAAQEIGHTWQSMDHVRVAADPMTYFGYTDRRYFQNTQAQCGSDCVNGTAPNGDTCTGAGTQSHACRCGGGLQTQNSYSIISGLFGLGPGTPPTVTMTPKSGASVQAMFSVNVDAMDDSGRIGMVELKIDGQLVGTSMTKPYVFNAPATLAKGNHALEATAYDPHGTAGKATADVYLGGPCNGESECERPQDVCAGGHCTPGPSVDGGLGTTCTMSSECLTNLCAMTASDGYCVEHCEDGQCPNDFDCTDIGGGQMVCWPASGGCGCSSDGRGGPLLLSLCFGVAVLTFRRRR